MCHELASYGFNICIVSRNQTKIDEKLSEIRQTYPLCETRAVVADLSQMFTMSEYSKLVADNISDLDVGYLALNAGIVTKGLTE